MNLVQALGQAVDFLWKAATTYAATPEGAKELNDVIVALEGPQETPQTQTVSEQIRTTTSRQRS